MKILYIISAYKRPDQLVRLVRRLNTPNARFHVHVDKKTDAFTCDRMVAGLRSLNNVHFLERHVCHWGDIGHVLASLKGIAAAIEQRIAFDYVLLLTGQDYPIKSNNYIENFLTKHEKTQFLSYTPIPCDPRLGWVDENGGLDRIESWSLHVGVLKRWIHLPPPTRYKSTLGTPTWKLLKKAIPGRKLPQYLQPFGGSSYWCMTRNCALYVHNHIRTNPQFLDFFRHVFVPDEIFFQTLILNSPLKNSVVNNDLRCIDWSSKGRGGRLPRIWCTEDFPTLASSEALIARKFDASLDSKILDLIDQRLLGVA
ncbi:beta-1,6-N-acetylglucosaminyltransferase [Azohydromonas australica]|uniref:beta-1,6-N-acetylglucosaminyltransferase n=1 Tax=Azohydromonas australica TaxID=364039 RepID=UPI000A029B33|nr:beta-1,6-N-acetylglucosaminyltransferase [Azohydromonas australica]